MIEPLFPGIYRNRSTVALALLFFTLLVFASCKNEGSSNAEMIALLANIEKSEHTMLNSYCPEAKLAYDDKIISQRRDSIEIKNAMYDKAELLLQMGKELQSINILEELMKGASTSDFFHIEMMKKLAIAYLRLGERMNCMQNRNGESCIFPIQGAGIQMDKRPTAKAIQLYNKVLMQNSGDLESRWLINIAYMAIGGYPKDVPQQFLIKNIAADTSTLVKPFTDVAAKANLNINNLSGGSIVEDFNNDGLPDIVTSSWSLKEGMHYMINKGDGSFADASASSGLASFTGGLNMMQTDYNNDGLKDIFVLRGGWKGALGKEPNSLLRNNGDGTFTDVTKQSGLLSFHPTQTATWNDFNNDGWLDVFIGNESTSASDANRCELYINNKNGSFSEVALKSNAGIKAFVKGVVSGDYNNDEWPDIFVSTQNKGVLLLKNNGLKNGLVHFENVTQQAGLDTCNAKTFSSCFFDYDNDGWLDILVCSCDFRGSLATYAAADALHMLKGNTGKQFLFRNNHDGTFKDMSNTAGFNAVAFVMGMNFGDIDNDGYPDLYFGTGNPFFQSLTPNKMYKNIDGKRFADVTSAARVGNLQKGHGVSFADIDNDGDEDLYMDMGGAFEGDAYPNSLYLNPGQNANNWINLKLKGTTSNNAAIGAKINVHFTENGRQRSVSREVNSGGSFGCNPLMQHIGIGAAKQIDRIEIKWPASETIEMFENIAPNKTIEIVEGKKGFE